MKKRLALIWAPVVMGVALMLPTSTMAATGYTFKIVNQHCESGGHGHNVYFRVSVTAQGSTSTNKLAIKSTSQYLQAGKWHNLYHWPQDKETFTANGTAHTADFSYEHYDPSSTTKWRIVSVLKAYHGKHVLASKTLTSKAC